MERIEETHSKMHDVDSIFFLRYKMFKSLVIYINNELS